ncbi:MAG: dockerin type I domain-containing protein [Eubacteriales bacterium]|nr:dockerin type I domain-containing protein [Eubacteriales bacterium]
MCRKRIISIVLSYIIFFTACPFDIKTAASGDYGFTERIVYGGSAVDVGDYIYFSNTEDNMRLYRRIACSENAELIYSAQVGYLNYFGGKIYFISDNNIISIEPTGENESLIYSSKSEISDLYVTSDCFYFLSQNRIFRLTDNKTELIYASDSICAFLPLNKYEFRLYEKNPEFKETDQTSEEIYTESAERFITYIYDTRTGEYSVNAPSYVKAVYNAPYTYSGPFVQVGVTTLPLAEYMPGTFFSKNGQACTCHHNPDVDCVDSLANCNCMRYWPTGIKSTCEIDLLGSQCFGFARLVFYKCFGFIDHSYYFPGRFYNVGSIRSGSVTAGSVKELFMKAKAGAHVRLTRGHSVSIFTMDENNLVVYHGNAGGDNVASRACVVSTKTYTWEQFAEYAVAGISYVNMPVEHPDNVRLTGYYKVTTEGPSSLNIRSGAGTDFTVLGRLDGNSFIKVTEVTANWGRIDYNSDSQGWICLDYAQFQTRSKLTPNADSSYYIDTEKNIIVCNSSRNDFIDFINCFPHQAIKVIDRYGNDLSERGYIGTGSVASIEINGIVADSMQVVVCGDANGNGIVDVGDYLITKRVFLGNYTAQNISVEAIDINVDGVVDSKDYLYIKRFLTGVSQSLRFA